ncbi:MAG: zinc ribbon domain-containing protein [Rhodocyclaceae bacterium]|nr:zinc ribbon domain-containing protein [Rhodocyclaceae bacterium]MDZ4213738.1 zinc ribbon domain-containing protein [Rhodocyclaceae bacterium]
MYCKHCGKPIDSDSKFCSTCGNEVTNTSAAVTSSNDYPVASAHQPCASASHSSVDFSFLNGRFSRWGHVPFHRSEDLPKKYNWLNGAMLLEYEHHFVALPNGKEKNSMLQIGELMGLAGGAVVLGERLYELATKKNYCITEDQGKVLYEGGALAFCAIAESEVWFYYDKKFLFSTQDSNQLVCPLKVIDGVIPASVLLYTTDGGNSLGAEQIAPRLVKKGASSVKRADGVRETRNNRLEGDLILHAH